MKTGGEREAGIPAAVIRFKREYMGRGPQDVRTYLLDDLALVRLKGVPTPAGQRLAQVEDPHRGRDLIKQLRDQILAKALADIERTDNQQNGALRDGVLVQAQRGFQQAAIELSLFLRDEAEIDCLPDPPGVLPVDIREFDRGR